MTLFLIFSKTKSLMGKCQLFLGKCLKTGICGDKMGKSDQL
jgi:hypothetical protein